MANAADLFEGPEGTPSQASLDAMVNKIEQNPPIDAVKSSIEKLNAYNKAMQEAIEKGAEEAYDAVREKFDEAKQEMLDWLNESKDSVADEVGKMTDGLKDEFSSILKDGPYSEIADVDITETGGVTITPNVPTSLDEVVDYLPKLVMAIMTPYEPIARTLEWWLGEFTTKLTAYISKRTSDLADLIQDVSDITPVTAVAGDFNPQTKISL